MNRFRVCTSILFAIMISSTMFPAPAATGPEVKGLSEAAASSDEERQVLASLKEEAARLAERQKQLDARELELKTLQAEVDKKLDQLARLKEENKNILAQKEVVEDARAKELSKMYEKMEPTKAAGVLATLDTSLAVAILANMKDKSAGKVLSSMEGAKASELSVAFARLKPPENKKP